MNREIKFRGKSLNGEWLHGDLIHQDGEVYVAPVDVRYPVGTSFKQFAVDHETIGQYTGLKDKNGVEIYEGDIFRDYGGCEYVVHFGVSQHTIKSKYTGNLMDVRKIGFHHTCIGYGDAEVLMSTKVQQGDIEVIGSIIDNPELLKGGQK